MKFKIEVVKTYIQNHIVEADDINHANEIGSEISSEMETNRHTFFESNWNATRVDDSSEVTYTPEQDYLK